MRYEEVLSDSDREIVDKLVEEFAPSSDDVAEGFEQAYSDLCKAFPQIDTMTPAGKRAFRAFIAHAYGSGLKDGFTAGLGLAILSERKIREYIDAPPSVQGPK